MANSIVRYASIDSRDILLNAALPRPEQQNILARLLCELGAKRCTRRNMLGQPLETQAARTLARVLYRQQILATDLADSTQLYLDLLQGPTPVLEPADLGYLVDGLTRLGRRDTAANLLDRFTDNLNELDAYSYLLANILNPHDGGGGDEHAWLAAVNSPLVIADLQPVHLQSGVAAPFFRLASKSVDSVNAGPLVSVLMPVFEADDSTDLAIASVLAQSWRNLELIIVDDASSPSGKARLKSWEGADARLRIVFNESNHGAYFARNTAFELAEGEYVTVSDKDDWHHPQKLERHMSDLARQTDRVANISCWSRVDENLSFLVRYAPLQLSHPSQPSLLFRRQPVQSRVGFWDNVRKGADGEYKARIEKVFGHRIQPFARTPLAFSLMGRENLTSTDFGLGFEHPDRSVYKQTYTEWHEQFPGQSSLKLDRSPSPRPFRAPDAFLPEKKGASRVDIIVAFDLSADNEESRAMREEIDAALAGGADIAVTHLYDPFRLVPKHKPPVRWLNRLILEGRVRRVSILDAVTATVFVLVTPRLLQFRPGPRWRLSANRVVVRADCPPFDFTTGAYSTRKIGANITSLFNQPAIWMPTTADIGLRLANATGRQPQDLDAWPGLGEILTQAAGVETGG